MFRFNGSWLDLFYVSFFVVGITVVGFLIFIILSALIIGYFDRRKKEKDKKTVLDLMSQDKRKERLEQMIEQSREELAELQKELERNKEKTDGDKEKNNN